jgi:hypothetical protein
MIRRPTAHRRLAWGLLLVSVGAHAAGWRLDADAERGPTARVDDGTGSEVLLYRDGAGQVFLEFRTAAAFGGLARSSCPTLQIDQRKPLYHVAVGTGCEVEATRAVFRCATIDGRTLVSRPVADLMSGEHLAVRYMTEEGAYHEARFSLARSADSIRGVLGRGVRVRRQ